MQKEITLKYVQELEYEYFFPPIPKLPRETAEILKLCRETVINDFCNIVYKLQMNNYYCCNPIQFKNDFCNTESPYTFSLADAHKMLSIHQIGKEITLRRIAMLLHEGWLSSKVYNYCYKYEFKKENQAKKREQEIPWHEKVAIELKAEINEKRKAKRELRKIELKNAPLTESEVRVILTYSHYSQQYWDLKKIIGRLNKKNVLRDFCRILYFLQVENNMEIFDLIAFSEFIDEYGKIYNYPPLYVEHIFTDSEGVDHCVKEPYGYDLSEVYLSEDECIEMLKTSLPYAGSLQKSIAVLMLARMEKEYIPQNDIEWTHISCVHILEYYFTKNPLILAGTERPIRSAPSNWVYPKLKPLDKRVVKEIVNRYQTYDKQAKTMRITQISTLCRKWDDKTKQEFNNAIACLPYNDEREIAILVNVGYSIEEISNYYRSLKV